MNVLLFTNQLKYTDNITFFSLLCGCCIFHNSSACLNLVYYFLGVVVVVVVVVVVIGLELCISFERWTDTAFVFCPHFLHLSVKRIKCVWH